MKKTLLMLGVLGAASLSAFGATACSATPIAFTASLTDGFSCEIGDKIFSNISGDTSFGGTISFTQLTATQYGLTYTAGSTPITGLFHFGFWVAVDTLTNPLNFITNMTDQMNTVQAVSPFGLVPNGSTDAVTHNTCITPSGCVVNLNAAGDGSGESSQASMFTQLEKVSMTYNGAGNAALTGGRLTSMEFKISQSSVPEPMTLSMMGIGLLGLGLMRRRQMGKK